MEKDSAFYIERAYKDLKMQNYTSMIANASKAIELDPKNAKAYFLCGTGYYSLD